MKIVIVGSGCVGTSTAFHLAEAFSHSNIKAKIKVLDQSLKGAAYGGASMGNACMLCPGSSIPRAAPYNVIRTLQASTATDTYINLQHSLWNASSQDRNAFLSFVKASAFHYPFTKKSTRNIALQVESLAKAGAWQFHTLMKSIPEMKTHLNYSKDSLEEAKEALGQLVLVKDSNGLNALINRLKDNLSQEYFQSIQVLDWNKCLQLEPCLAEYHADGKLYGGVFKSKEQVIEPIEFIQSMVTACQRLGVQFDYGVNVKQIITSEGGNEVSIVKSNPNDIEEVEKSDLLILCAGAHSATLLQNFGLSCPIFGLKGYSLTLDFSSENRKQLLPKNGIVFSDYNCYTTPLRNFGNDPNANFLRITNFGDLDGLAIGQINSHRLERLLKQVQHLYPGIITENEANECLEKSKITRSSTKKNFFGWDEKDKLKAWTGLRPFSPDYKAIIGTYLNNPKARNKIYVNSGHGVMGWTTSNISSALLTKQIFTNTLGQDLPQDCLAAKARLDLIDENWFLPERFTHTLAL